MAMNQVLRAVLAETAVEDWQGVCDLATIKIICSSPDGCPSHQLRYGRTPEFLADRLISAAFQLRSSKGDGSMCVDNSGASVAGKFAEGLRDKRRLLEEMNVRWEDRFIR